MMVGTIHFRDGRTEDILGYGHNPHFYCFTRSGNYMCKSYDIPVEDRLGCVLWMMRKYEWYRYSNDLENWIVTDIDYVTVYKEE